MRLFRYVNNIRHSRMLICDKIKLNFPHSVHKNCSNFLYLHKDFSTFVITIAFEGSMNDRMEKKNHDINGNSILLWEFASKMNNIMAMYYGLYDAINCAWSKSKMLQILVPYIQCTECGACTVGCVVQCVWWFTPIWKIWLFLFFDHMNAFLLG